MRLAAGGPQRALLLLAAAWVRNPLAAAWAVPATRSPASFSARPHRLARPPLYLVAPSDASGAADGEPALGAADGEQPAPPEPDADGELAPPASGASSPLPRFSWRTVAFIALNPAFLLPLPLVAVLLHIDLLGSSFGFGRSVLVVALRWAAPLFALSVLPLERIPVCTRALREVSQASETICLYALGHRLVPLRALLAASLLSASAAVCEELAFRGVLQTLALAALSRLGLGARAATALAVGAQALLFGLLHAYTPSAVYVIAASLAGVGFGAAFASSSNLAVPVIMHFALDLVSFGVCHVQVARGGEEKQQRLLAADFPIARALRDMATWGIGAPPDGEGGRDPRLLA